MDEPARPRRRLPSAERQIVLIEGAAAAFAEDGFGVTTRELARRMGVTQALLYKHFPSKDALIDAVLERRFLAERSGPDPRLLDGPGALDGRIAAFYIDFVNRATRQNLRLFLRASLDGVNLPVRYRSRLDQRYLMPILGALRREAGLPNLEALAVSPAERELAVMLHGALVFTLIRRDVYRVAFPVSHPDIVALQARVYAAGALAEMRRQHAAGD
ncbi:helix-turn-helix domain-containing protein [Thalassobaculum sp.]|uniref:TetR/AcrR family transcriptional regulator n=1 Tax=Thalassobaculum sp. TaxID=2022740 RepID=UPI0032ED8BD4